MGLTYAECGLVNAIDQANAKKGFLKPENVKKLTVRLLVDSGAYMLFINEEIRAQLDLDIIDRYPAQMADGSVVEMDVAGPLQIRFENRKSNSDALVLPGNAEPLLGAIPMESLDVVLNPLKQQLIVNPEHPLRPQFSIK